MSNGKPNARPSTLVLSLSSPLPTGNSLDSIDGLSTDNHTVGTSDWYNFRSLSPAFILPRSAQIEPDAPAIHHRNASKTFVHHSYQEFVDRTKGLAYLFLKRGYKRIGILPTNTPAFLESIFDISVAGAVNFAVNYRLTADDITNIFDHSDADSIVVDVEFPHLLKDYRMSYPDVAIIVDTNRYTGLSDGEPVGPFDSCVIEGLRYDVERGSQGWAANVIEASLSYHDGERCKYLWTLPMFHASGWTFSWTVTAARGTHYCLRKVDYAETWRLLKQEGITHYCAAPAVNMSLCKDSNAERLSRNVRVTVAASPPTADLFEQMINLNLNPVHMYGLTETYGPITKQYILPEWDMLQDKKAKYAKIARQSF